MACYVLLSTAFQMFLELIDSKSRPSAVNHGMTVCTYWNQVGHGIYDVLRTYLG